MVGFREQRRGGLAPPGSRASPPPVRRGMGRGEGGTPVSRGVCVPLPARTYLPATSLEVGFGGGGGEGVLRAPPPPPHAPSRPWRRPRLPSFPTGRGPPGVDPPVACRGLRGVTGWRLPVAGGRPPCPVASRRRPWTGLPRPVAGRSSAALGACRAVARRLPRARPPPPPEPRGFLPPPPPTTPPAALCPVPSPSLALPLPLSCVPLCPLGATLPVGAPFPLPSVVVGGEGAWGRGRGLGGPRWTGERVVAGSRERGPAGCARWCGGGGRPLPRFVGDVWGVGRLASVGGPLRARSDRCTVRPPCVTGRQRRGPRAAAGVCVGCGGWWSASGRWPVGRAVPPRPPPPFQVPSASRRGGLKTPGGGRPSALGSGRSGPRGVGRCLPSPPDSAVPLRGGRGGAWRARRVAVTAAAAVGRGLPGGRCVGRGRVRCVRARAPRLPGGGGWEPPGRLWGCPSLPWRVGAGCPVVCRNLSRPLRSAVFLSDLAGQRQLPSPSQLPAPRFRGGKGRRGGRGTCRARGGSPAETKHLKNLVRLLAVDHSARASMKNAASCEN